MERKRLCICDIDGVVADSTERFKQATRPDGTIDWNMALNGDYVHLDTLIEGAVEHLAWIMHPDRCDERFLLTSRYDHMRDATMKWLRDRDIDLRVGFKPWDQRYTKTKAWKAEWVLRLAKRLKATELIVIDDEQANLDEIQRVVGLNHPAYTARMRVYFSLAEAVEVEADDFAQKQFKAEE